MKRLSQAHREKLSNALKGKAKSIEHIEKVRKALTGRRLSEEHRRKLSLAHIGLDNHQTGRHHTEEARLKISKANKGNQSRLGITHTQEARKKISLAKRGKPSWNKGLKGYRAGAESHLWKGGITAKDRLERLKFRHTMQKLVFERDNYTCQMCGNNRDLQVDHIQSWAEYVEQRFNMDNCRTLCMSCHYLITFNKPMPKDVKAWGHNLGRREIL